MILIYQYHKRSFAIFNPLIFALWADVHGWKNCENSQFLSFTLFLQKKY